MYYKGKFNSFLCVAEFINFSKREWFQHGHELYLDLLVPNLVELWQNIVYGSKYKSAIIIMYVSKC